MSATAVIHSMIFFIVRDGYKRVTVIEIRTYKPNWQLPNFCANRL